MLNAIPNFTNEFLCGSYFGKLDDALLSSDFSTAFEDIFKIMNGGLVQKTTTEEIASLLKENKCRDLPITILRGILTAILNECKPTSNWILLILAMELNL